MKLKHQIESQPFQEFINQKSEIRTKYKYVFYLNKIVQLMQKKKKNTPLNQLPTYTKNPRILPVFLHKFSGYPKIKCTEFYETKYLFRT